MITITQEQDVFSTKADGNVGTLLDKGFGIKTGKTVVFNIYEAVFLVEKKKAHIHKFGKPQSLESVRKKKIFKEEEYVVFKDLRSKGYGVGTALKYGFTFRVYEKNVKKNTHAKWLVDVVKETDLVKMKELSARNRVAHSTKKHVLLAIVDSEMSVLYLEMQWFRP